jgi:hypothetical protein
MMETDRVLRNLRHMAWERAKGELRSMTHTYWDDREKFVTLKRKMEEFIADVEGNEDHK